ncbi:penicillin-binding protein 1C [Xaviernesmea oryzae]|uniref:peptidoglycan glycosyltransferase n=1 Tax=Xaviernesmea oryzae TaxID=464029 RepID=A0A1Q9AYF9_9HYPH|nr:penicillin-binding protein 1C [Xaviernesmea oryzae]OLP60450.1 penicillin-binding protein 1C [Xaviernesmea oryzae]
MKRLAWAACGLVAAGALLLIGLNAADRAFPPPLDAARIVSPEVLDRDGRLLRAFPTLEGYMRLKTKAEEIDPQLTRMLVAYEDQRFYTHHGIDLQALARAAGQLVTQGHIVSGASTLSMQLARLIEPRTERSLPAKLRQILRALQIERRLSKAEILDLYLTRAPYGGNLEGVRAASLAYFGKEPRRLTTAEAALLVALPQLPERRRPDRHPQAAEAARARVLARLAVSRLIGQGEAARAELEPVPRERRELPAHAPHVAEAARRKGPLPDRTMTTLDRDKQSALEAVAEAAAARLDPQVTIAMILADAETGAILSEVGSADFTDRRRRGFVDMVRVPRSPGSTLKPFIYGLAFEQGLIAQDTIIEDRPADFFGYRPRNFDMSYQGDVTIRQALQLSLNVPAVRLLDAVGPTRLIVRFRRAGVEVALPPGAPPGLAIGLGGLGISLRDLVQLYAALARRGAPVTLGNGVDRPPRLDDGEALIEPGAAWQVTDILSGVQPPQGSARRLLAYKTGTSYGYRDAWSIGFDGRFVLGVWVGRADNGAVPAISGYATAAPILFEAFARSGLANIPLPRAPSGARRLGPQDLPATLRRFSADQPGLSASARRPADPAPRIVYPPEGARVELSPENDGEGLTLKLQGGRAPFRWLANGRPLPEPSLRRTSQWQPDGLGFSTLTVIDAAGRAASVRVFLQKEMSTNSP